MNNLTVTTMKAYILAVMIVFSCWRAPADVNIEVLAGILADSGGNALSSPTTGWIVVVAGTAGGGFGGPTAGSFVSGADVLLWQGLWDSELGDGIFNRSFSVDEALVGGRAVQLYWYPTLGAGDLPVFGETTYGAYRDPVGIDTSDPWFVPIGPGDQALLIFGTQSVDGSNPDSAGYALAVVPEASNLVLGGLALGLVAFRFVPQFRRKHAKS